MRVVPPLADEEHRRATDVDLPATQQSHHPVPRAVLIAVAPAVHHAVRDPVLFNTKTDDIAVVRAAGIMIYYCAREQPRGLNHSRSTSEMRAILFEIN